MRTLILRATAALLLSPLAFAPAALAQTSATTTSPSSAPGAAPVIAPSGVNPPGTAASRALDKAAGTNTSGAYPAQSDGTRTNPPGTAAGRATDRATQHNGSHNAQNTRNNSATRGVDRAAGTNNSGAYPAQSDGTPGNPPGTAVSRTLGTTNK